MIPGKFSFPDNQLYATIITGLTEYYTSIKTVSVVAGKLCLSVLSMPKNETPPLHFQLSLNFPHYGEWGPFGM